MSARDRRNSRYSYTYNFVAQDQRSPSSGEASGEDAQRFVNASLGLMMGGCEICAHAHYSSPPALFCEKRKTPVLWGSPRCELFSRGSAQSQDPLA
jgi:hypothetical protein